MVVSAYGFQKDKSAHSIVLQKNVGVGDAAVNMGFRGDVYDGVHLVDESTDELGVADVAFDEGVASVVFDFMQVCWVGAYAHLVHVNYFAVRVGGQHVPDEVASDKT